MSLKARDGIQIFWAGIRHMDKFLFSWILVCILRWIVGLVDVILDQLCGYTFTKGWRSEREKAKEYEYSAQVFRH